MQHYSASHAVNPGRRSGPIAPPPRTSEERGDSVRVSRIRATSWPAFWVGHRQHGRRLRYPSRLTLLWRLASRTAGPSTRGGRFVCWLVGGTDPTSLRSLSPPWGGFVAVGMRKIGRMSSRLVTATPPAPRPAPPGGRAPLPRARLNRPAGLKARVAVRQAYPVTMAAGVTGAGAVAARRRPRPSRWGRRPAPWPALGRGARRRRGGR
jgi:hypothetical protein